MNLPRWIALVGVLFCLAASYIVSAQRGKLRELRAAAQGPAGESGVEPAETKPADSLASAPLEPATSSRDANGSAAPGTETKPVSTELLRLRSQVTLLRMRKRELSGVEHESGQLRLQSAQTHTNSSGLELPPGFIRKSETRFAGYQTPEATIESLFWAFQQQDLTNVLKAFSPEVAQKIQKEAMSSANFFSEIAAIPGFAIQSSSNAPDGMVDLNVMVAPGIPSQNLRLRQIDGEWKVITPGF